MTKNKTEAKQSEMDLGKTEPTQEVAGIPPTAEVAADDFASMTGGAMVPAADNEEEGTYLGGADTFLPRLRLAQGQTQEVTDGLARPGDWVVEDCEPAKEALFLPMKYAGMRRRIVKSDSDGRGDIVCRADRLYFSGPNTPFYGKGDPGIECAKCEFSQWQPRNDGSGKNAPPACTLVHIFEGKSLTHGTAVELHLQKTGEKVVPGMKKMMEKHGGIGHTVFKLTTTKEQSAAGKSYFEPQFAAARVTDEMRAQADAIREKEEDATGYVAI